MFHVIDHVLGEDHRHLEEPKFSLTRSLFLSIFYLFFIPLFHDSMHWTHTCSILLFICYHVWMFIYDIAVMLIYYSDYIACSGYFRLNVYAWGIFPPVYTCRFSSRLRSHVFWEAERDRVFLVSEPCLIKEDLVLTTKLKQVILTLQYT